MTFRGLYLEINKEEEILGTLDWFRLTLTNATILDNGESALWRVVLVFRKLCWSKEEFGPNLRLTSFGGCNLFNSRELENCYS